MSQRSSLGRRGPSGFTLLEAAVVVLILAAVAGIVIAMTGEAGESGRRDATWASMVRIREAALGRYFSDIGAPPHSIADLLRRRTNPLPEVPQVPLDGIGPGWRGPYLHPTGALYAEDATRGFRAEYGPSATGLPAAPAIRDGWGRPIVLQIPNSVLQGPDSRGFFRLSFRPIDLAHARLVSAGPDGVIDTPHRDEDALAPATDALFPSRSQCGDDGVLYLRQADLRP